jgi:hypothetical protein
MSRWTSFRDRVVTDDAVYGTVLFAALIATSSAPDPHSDGIPGDVVVQFGGDSGDIVDVLIVSVTTLLVFWVAHVYARVLARGGLGDAIRHSSGMLWAAIPPTLLLVLGAVGVLPDAVDWSGLLSLAVLGFVGYEAAARRGRGVGVRILSGAVAVVLGFIIIVVKVAVH